MRMVYEIPNMVLPKQRKSVSLNISNPIEHYRKFEY